MKKRDCLWYTLTAFKEEAFDMRSGKVCNWSLLLGLAIVISFHFPVFAQSNRSIWGKKTETQQLFKNDNPWNIQISSKEGFVVEYSAPKLSPVVAHIQDAHANPPAQFHTSEILKELVENHGFKLVCVEGADGGFDNSLFNIEKSSLKEKVIRYFVDEVRLTGAEYQWLLHSKPGRMYKTPF